MNFLTRILLISLLVASALTFYGCQSQNEGGTTTATSTTVNDEGSLKIVFVRLDSLQLGYTALATEMERLQENVEKADENIKGQMAKLQNEMLRDQNKIQRGEMTPKMIQQEQQRLGGTVQKIMQQRNIALACIQECQSRTQKDYGKMVKDILEAIQEEKGYDYILNEGGGSGVLVARDAFDITEEVLVRLNAADATMAKDSVQ